MQIRQALGRLNERELSYVTDYVYGSCLARFPVLDYLVLTKATWVTKTEILEYAVADHPTIWPTDPNDIDGWTAYRIADELSVCAVGYLRTVKFPAALSILNNDRLLREVDNEIASLTGKITVTLENGLHFDDDWSKGLFWHLLKLLQIRKHSTNRDLQEWDFLWTIIQMDTDFIHADSWSLSTISEKMNEDDVTPPPSSSAVWTHRNLEAVRDRFVRFITNLRQTSQKETE